MSLSNITDSIRIDATTRKGSVIDVICMVNPHCDNAYASRILTRLDPDLCIDRIRINGKGRETPVADYGTLVQLVFQLPGRAASDFRRKSAYQVCRLLGGDTTLIREIESRNEWWQHTTARRSVQSELLQPPAPAPEDAQQAPARMLEATVRDALAAQECGKVEVQTPVGYADIVTSSEVIEVKHYSSWKHAFGQVMAYSAHLPGLKRRIHLFAKYEDVDAAKQAALAATNVCLSNSVTVTLEVLGGQIQL